MKNIIVLTLDLIHNGINCGTENYCFSNYPKALRFAATEMVRTLKVNPERFKEETRQELFSLLSQEKVGEAIFTFNEKAAHQAGFFINLDDCDLDAES